MAYRSWLKDVRKLQDLAPFLRYTPNSKRENSKEINREWDLQSKDLQYRLHSKLPVDFKSERYFKGSLYDGFVLGLERSETQIELTIENIELEEFIQLYNGETGNEIEDWDSPVRLVFEGVNYANAVRPDHDGWLKWDDWKHLRIKEDFFIRCWFHQDGGKIQWIGEFDAKGTANPKSFGDLYVLIDCEKVSAYPESEKLLRKRMGDECYEAMLYINYLPRSEMWLATGHLRRYLDEKGIARRSIPDQSERE